jgi:hypothetical protein
LANFFNNLFGTIAQHGILGREPGNISFIPINSNGQTLTIKGQNAIWLGLDSRLTQYKAYLYCTPFASVVDRLAEADVSGQLEFIRSKGKGKEDIATSEYANRLRALFRNPNPMQSWEDFRAEQVVIKKIHGFCPVYVIKPAGFKDPSYADYMFNLDPRYFNVIPTYKYYKQKDISGIVDYYTITTIQGETLRIEPENIIILKDSYIKDENYYNILPKSRVVGLDFAISNYCAAMEADNVLLKKKGPLGIFSHDSGTKDSNIGYLPMQPDEQKELQDSLAGYGLNWSQLQHVISRQAIKWIPTSFNVNELGTNATIIKATKAICYRYGYSYILLEDSDATFSNQSGAHKALFQNNVIPNNRMDIADYNNYFKCEENNCRIEMDFSALAIMQEDELHKAQAVYENAKALELQYKNDIITKNQWLTAQGYDTVTGGDVYYSETTKQINNEPTSEDTGVAIEG